ncbi:MAG: MFS transporter [Dehalococcoidia bacterium]
MHDRRAAPEEDALPAKSHGAWRETFQSFQHRDFRLLWIGSFGSAGGIWLMQVSLGWLAYEMTQSALQVGLILGVRAAPLLLAPLTGVIADRIDRRRLLLADQAFLVVLVMTFAVVLLLERQQVWHLYVFAELFGMGWAVSNPVRQMLTATTVPREDLTNAIALMSIAFNSMRAIGPAIGGIFIAFFGPGVNFLLMGILFLAVFLLVVPFRARYGTTDRTIVRAQSVMRNLVEGFRYVRHEPTTLTAISVTTAMTLTSMALVFNQLPVYAAEVLLDDEGVLLGLLMMSLGIGGLVGTSFMARFSRIRHKGIVGTIGFVCTSLAVLTLSQVSVLWAAMLTLAVQQAFVQLVMTSNQTIVQSITPDDMRGRVTGVYQMEIGMMPIGGVIAGAISAAYGVQTAFAFGAVTGLMVITLFAVFVPRYRRLEL